MINIITIGDIHFGSAATPRLPQELIKFTDYISKNDVDMVVFTGDYFDHKLNIAPPDEAYTDGINFFNTILELSKARGFKIRLIHGTLSHDRFQTRIFGSMVPSGVDYKYYETAAKEDIFFGDKGTLHCCFLPEEYPTDAKTYYLPLQKEKYDVVFGHGTCDCLPIAAMILAHPTIGGAPVFLWDDWKQSLSEGVAVFGHIHARSVNKKDGIARIIYPGSFTSWNFNNTTPCGFLYLNFDADSKKFRFTIIDNDGAPSFRTLTAEDLGGIDLSSMSIDDAKKRIQGFKEEFSADNVKFSIAGLPADKTEILKKMFDGSAGISAETPDVSQTAITESVDSSIYAKYEWLLKDQLPIAEAIQKFGHDEMNVDLSIDTIKKAIAEEK